MTAVQPPTSAACRSGSPREAAPTWLARLESGLDSASQWLNPILVKESRQALKSKQFVITFALVLFFGWGWSLLGVALATPGIYYAPGGRYMLVGYFLVLAFPLVVIVPFSAFHSLASERVDGTYELLSISTLRPRQIVGGKLGSAVLQMLIYLSALSPCIAFTYLLRGIDIVVIAMVLFYSVLESILLSILALMLASIARTRVWQVVLSVVTILGLVFVLLVTWSYGGMLLGAGMAMPYDEPMFWIGQAAFVSACASYCVLFFLAAAATITFASDNRSTALRVAMLAQHVLLVGWTTWFYLDGFDPGAMGFLVFVAGVHWYLMGALMTGQSPQLSPRVQRQLPQSFLGRMFLTCFFPGPGTGYLFAVASLLSVVVLAAAALGPAVWNAYLTAGGRFFSDDAVEILAFAVVWFCYMVCYVGVGRLVLMLLGRFLRVNVLLAALVQLFLLAMGALVPLVLQLSLGGLAGAGFDYTPLQITNWVWTSTVAADGDIMLYTVPGTGVPVVPALLMLATGAILLANFTAAAGEMRHARQEVPRRVREDELVLHPEKAPKPPPRTSPWD